MKNLIEHSSRIERQLRVRSLRILAVLVALAWVPLMSHCQLESVDGLEFLGCAADTDSLPADCSENGCCSVERSDYQAPGHQETIPILILAPLPAGTVAGSERSSPLQAILGPLTAAPPEMSAAWQFISRTAPPCRAPSLAS